MKPLEAAIKGAEDFHDWAQTQGCDATILVDGISSRVSLSEIFDAVFVLVEAGTYDQLIIYFSGHGILLAPEAEYWLLSSSPQNPNEAVNLARSIADGRNSGIPHVVFVSDACRSSASGPPLSGVSGGGIFPSGSPRQLRSQIDVFYATRPGDPAYEVGETEAAERHGGIFTNTLLEAVKSPKAEWVESVEGTSPALSVITARRLKSYLEETVSAQAAEIDIKLRQEPEVRSETALPMFFAAVDPESIVVSEKVVAPPRATRLKRLAPGRGLSLGLRTRKARPARDRDLAQAGLEAEVERLIAARGRGHFETETGFTVFGVSSARGDALRWQATPFYEGGDEDALHMRLEPTDPQATEIASSLVLELSGDAGTVLPVLPGFIGTVVVDSERVVSVNYVPSNNSGRVGEYQERALELEQMKAVAAVAARNGRFIVDEANAGELAGRIRQGKGIDPTMGVYAAYAYAQVGQYEDAYSVFEYMRDDEFELPIPFDVLMLASRFQPDARLEPGARFAPFAPMLSQGWSLLASGDSMHDPLHEELRPHLLPSLWTTLDLDGIEIARASVLSGRVT